MKYLDSKCIIACWTRRIVIKGIKIKSTNDKLLAFCLDILKRVRKRIPSVTMPTKDSIWM
jgi:hypothetical protein